MTFSVPFASASRLGARPAAVSLFLLLSACQGQIGDAPFGSPTGTNRPTGPTSPTGTKGTSGTSVDPSGGGNGSGKGSPPSSAVETPSPSTRFPRLSHEQWENTAQDLLRLSQASGLAASFLQDATSGSFSNRATELRVGSELWQNYQLAAEKLAEQVTTDAAALARIAVPGTGDPVAQGRNFIATFGRRAFRRPLSDAEIAPYAGLFARGTELFPEMPAFAGGVRLVVAAMLQSLNYLYRVEWSTQIAGNVIPLNDWEIASRLSYALWNTMPDDDLFIAAQAGELTRADGLQKQLARMLADHRVQSMVGSFHHQLMDLDRYGDLTRSTTLFPEFTKDLPTSMVGEAEAFIQYVVFEQRAGLETLLTAPYTFVDAELARVYKMDGTFDSSFRRAPLDGAQRAGLLTQLGFLTLNANQTDTDPIHRGVFINRRILCATLPAPPNNVPPLPPVMGVMTMRQRITAHTGPGTCGASCHGTIINPVGFAYEHYDALGRWRDTDNGLPVDAKAEYQFADGAKTYDGAVDFARVIAAEPMAHRCYSSNWLEYLYGRAPADLDAPLLNRLATASMSKTLPVIDAIAQLVSSGAFLTRSIEEEMQ